MTQSVLDAIRQVGTNFATSVVQLLPRTLITLSIIVVGWFIAVVCRWLTRWVLDRIGFNGLCARHGVAALLRTADLPSGETLASGLIFWLVWGGFLVSGVDVLGFAALTGLVDAFGVFVPRLLVAVAILVAGFVSANIAWRATVLAAINGGVPSPRMLGGAVRAMILILAGAMALDQIAVARTIVLTAFAIAFGAVMLGLAVAFGIGGGGIARRTLNHLFPERTTPGTDGVKHL